MTPRADLDRVNTFCRISGKHLQRSRCYRTHDWSIVMMRLCDFLIEPKIEEITYFADG